MASNPLCLMQHPQPPGEHRRWLRGAAETGEQRQCLAHPLFPSPRWEVGRGLLSAGTSRGQCQHLQLSPLQSGTGLEGTVENLAGLKAFRCWCCAGWESVPERREVWCVQHPSDYSHTGVLEGDIPPGPPEVQIFRLTDA